MTSQMDANVAQKNSPWARVNEPETDSKSTNRRLNIELFVHLQ